MDHSDKTRFLKYLTGLAIAAGSVSPALANTPPPRPASVQSTVAFADNLSDKIDAVVVAATKPAPGPYKQTFGELWVLEWPWWQIVHATGLDATRELPDLLPSDAFKQISEV